MIKINFKILVKIIVGFLIIFQQAESYGQVNTRDLSEINAFERSESYPFLSSDALTLYFVQSTSPGQGNIYKVSRTDNSINVKFGTLTQVNTFSDGNIHSFTLSADELNLYYTTWNQKIYSMNRVSKTASFGNLRQICLNNFNVKVHNGSTEFMTLSSPSVSIDKNSLYLYYNNNYNGYILKLNKTLVSTEIADTSNYPAGCYTSTGNDYYKFAGTLDNPNSNTFISYYSGQLDKSYSNYDHSVINTSTKFEQKLAKFTNPGGTLPGFVKQDESYSFTPFGVIQPSFSTRQIYAFVASTGDWLDNDIYMSYTNNVSLRSEMYLDETKNYSEYSNNIRDKESSSNELLLIPNPATTYVKLVYQDLQLDHNIQIYNSSGEILLDSKLSKSTTELDLNPFSNGLYYIKSTSNNGTTQFKKLLINK